MAVLLFVVRMRVQFFYSVILQKKTLGILSIKLRNTNSSFYSKKLNLTISRKIHLKNILFVRESVNNLLVSLLNLWFTFSSGQHDYETLRSTKVNLIN